MSQKPGVFGTSLPGPRLQNPARLETVYLIQVAKTLCDWYQFTWFMLPEPRVFGTCLPGSCRQKPQVFGTSLSGVCSQNPACQTYECAVQKASRSAATIQPRYAALDRTAGYLFSIRGCWMGQ